MRLTWLSYLRRLGLDSLIPKGRPTFTGGNRGASIHDQDDPSLMFQIVDTDTFFILAISDKDSPPIKKSWISFTSISDSFENPFFDPLAVLPCLIWSSMFSLAVAHRRLLDKLFSWFPSQCAA